MNFFYLISLSIANYLPQPRTIVKTSSGKIARQRVRNAYLEGSLYVVADWTEALDGVDNR